jgi:hypothetical protein
MAQWPPLVLLGWLLMVPAGGAVSKNRPGPWPCVCRTLKVLTRMSGSLPSSKQFLSIANSEPANNNTVTWAGVASAGWEYLLPPTPNLGKFIMQVGNTRVGGEIGIEQARGPALEKPFTQLQSWLHCHQNCTALAVHWQCIPCKH